MRIFATAGAALLLVVGAWAQQTRTLKVDVELVQVYATVMDSLGHYVVGLEPENFQISEDRVEQKIESFSTEDVPLSVGIILDVSNSMKDVLSTAKDAAATFLKMGSPEDEYFLVEFNDRAKVTQDFTTDIEKLKNHIVFLPAKGRTALFDGVYLGLSTVREGTNPRKFLLAVTDGDENHSHYTYSQVRDFAREQDVQVYAIGGGGGFGGGSGGSLGDIVEMTGGRVFRFGSSNDLEDICAKIAIEVKNQYVIGYRSTNEKRDGKYRKIRVKITPPKGMTSPLVVRAKDGYTAPAGF